MTGTVQPTRAPQDLDLGLTTEEALGRAALVGPNALPAPSGPRYLVIAAHQVRDPLVALLLAAAAVSFLIGETVEAAVIGAIVVLNGVLGFAQEVGAERAVLSLRSSIRPTASVVRDGVERLIAAQEIVPGDLIVVREGDRVPADARVVRAEALALDESALTGESLPVDKVAGAADEAAPLAERPSTIFAGTGVTRGRGRALVVETGPRTEIGRIAELTAQAKTPPTPLQRRLASLSRAMVALGVAVTLALTVGMLARGEGLQDAFLVGVSVAVAAVPEGLAATVTMALGQSAAAMARRGAIVRRLAAVETLGSATVIATDKTGTLTRNELRVAGVRPAGSLAPGDLLEAAALASTAELVEEGGMERMLGDPVDGAVLLALAAEGAPDPRRSSNRTLLYEIPFDPQEKFQAAVWQEGAGARLVVKGAPEVLLPCAADAHELEPTVADWAASGLRVLAVAELRVEARASETQSPGDGLRVLGLVAFGDPLRPGAADAVHAAQAAGLEVAIVTGDHPLTAGAIARSLRLPEAAVRARMTPADKLRLVESLQREGHVVAVTGDGINDAPALRRADVGIAMGASGTEAAREAADVVLTDDDFATIVAAIAEGRRIADNVRSFVAFLLSANLGEVVLFGAAILAGLGAPMTVVQVLTINLLTDGLPAVALARDPAAAGVMWRRPRGLQTLFTRSQQVALVLAGVAVGAAATAAYVVGREYDAGLAQTMAFATVALAELVLVFSIRTGAAPFHRGARNRALVGAVALSALFVVLAVWWPPLADVLGTSSLDATAATVVLVLALAPAGLVELAKWTVRRGSHSLGGGL